MIATGSRAPPAPPARDTTSIAASPRSVQPLQRRLVEVDHRQAVEVLERARRAMNCSRSGTTLTSMNSRLRDLDQLQQLGVLLERQRDVQMVDRFARCVHRRPKVPSSGNPR